MENMCARGSCVSVPVCVVQVPVSCFLMSDSCLTRCRRENTRDECWTPPVGQNRHTFQLQITSAVDLPPDK